MILVNKVFWEHELLCANNCLIVYKVPKSRKYKLLRIIPNQKTATTFLDPICWTALFHQKDLIFAPYIFETIWLVYFENQGCQYNWLNVEFEGVGGIIVN